VTVGNYGVSGTTMMKESNSSYWDTGDLAMVETFVTNAGPSANVAIIIMLGTNDSKDNPSDVDNWTSTAPTRYAADYNSMIDELLAVTPTPEIFLALPPPAFANTYDIDGTVIADQIIPIIIGIATDRQLPVIDVHSALAGMSSLFPDGVHPNDMGHMIIATTMENGLLSPAIPVPDGGLIDAAASDDAAGVSDAATSEDAVAPFDASIASDASSTDSNDGGVLAEAGGSSDNGGAAASSGGSGCGCTTARSYGVDYAWLAGLAILVGIYVRTRVGHARRGPVRDRAVPSR
jgi:acyl-CoA thioesterase I